MTQEDKAKAYDEAVERARKYMAKGYDVLMPEIFPELAESEDERIRKEILNVFKQLDEGTTICGRNYDYAKWISWIEKQGEKKSPDEVLKIRQELYQSGYNDGYKHGCEDTQKQGEQKLANSAKTCKKSQRMISAEAKEALYDKPAWTEEDDEMLDGIILRCEKYGHQEQINWLKSLKERIGG